VEQAHSQPKFGAKEFGGKEQIWGQPPSDPVATSMDWKKVGEGVCAFTYFLIDSIIAYMQLFIFIVYCFYVLFIFSGCFGIINDG